MEELMLRLAAEAPTLAVVLFMFWVLRQDVLEQFSWLRELIESLIEKLDDSPDTRQ